MWHHNRSLYRLSQAGRAWGGRNSSEGRHKKGSNLNVPVTEESEPVESNAELKKQRGTQCWKNTSGYREKSYAGERAVRLSARNAATEVGTNWWSMEAITTAISFEGEVEWARSNCWNGHWIPRKWRSRKQVRRPVVEHRMRRRHTENLEKTTDEQANTLESAAT